MLVFSYHNIYTMIIIIIQCILTDHPSHRLSGGDTPPPELPSSPPPPIGFTGRESIDNDTMVSCYVYCLQRSLATYGVTMFDFSKLVAALLR